MRLGTSLEPHRILYKMGYMPAATHVTGQEALLLKALGARLAQARKQRGLTAQEVADAADITRVTLSRMEVGQPATVTLGTLAKVLSVLGMAQDIALIAGEIAPTPRVTRRAPAAPERRPKTSPVVPKLIALKDLPELRQAAAWHIANTAMKLKPEEVFSLYERNWRHLDRAKIVGKEAKILDSLTKTVGKGVLLV